MELGSKTSYFPRWLMILLAVGLAAVNALVSFYAVVLAVPGSGTIHLGFKIIAGTFIIGNILNAILGIWAASKWNRRGQIIGLVVQFLTIPICLGITLLAMWLAGTDTL